MSVSSDTPPHEAVDSGGLPITSDSGTTIASQSLEHDTQPGSVKAHPTTMADTVAAQEAKVAGAEEVVNIPAKVEPLDGVERVPGAVDDKPETAVESDGSRETALVHPKHPDFASETVQVTESNSTDSTPIESEEPREDTKEAAAIASTTPSTIEAQDVVGVQDTKEEEEVTGKQFEPTETEGDTAQEIALSPTQESTSAAQQATGKPPATVPLTIQLDAIKLVEGVTLSESLDDLSSNQADKANEEGPEIPIESEMTFASPVSPVSPVSVTRAVSVAGEESVPGTPVSETYSDAGTRASTPGLEDGDAPRARTKAEKKRAKRLRQKHAPKDAAAMKTELDGAQIEVPAVPTPVEEAKEGPVSVKEHPSVLVREPTAETPALVEEVCDAVKEEVVPAEEEGVKETKQEPIEVQVEETVAEPTPAISEDKPTVEAAAEEPTPIVEQVPKVELAVENAPKAEAAVVEPAIEEASNVEAVVEDTPDMEVALKAEPVAEEPAPVVEEVPEVEPVAEEVPKIEQPANNEEEPKVADVKETVKVEEAPIVEEDTTVEELIKTEEGPKVEAAEEPVHVAEGVEVEEPVKAEGEIKVEEPNQGEEAELEETPKVVEDVKIEEPVQTEEDVKVEETPKLEAPVEEFSAIERTTEAEVGTEEPVLAVEEAISAEDPAPPVETPKEEHPVEAASAPITEEPKDVEVTCDKVDEVESTSAQRKIEVPADVKAGLVEPVSTPALLEDTKAAIPEILEPVKEVEPQVIVAATAEKLEVPTGVVEPIASPAHGEGLVEENEPIAEQLDAALEDVKVEEVADEIDAALEEVKKAEEPAAEMSKKAEPEVSPIAEEVKETEPEITPAVEEIKPEPVSLVEEATAQEHVEAASEPPVVAEEIKEPAAIEQSVVKEVKPKAASPGEAVEEAIVEATVEVPVVEAAHDEPIVEEAVHGVEEPAQPAVEHPVVAAPNQGELKPVVLAEEVKEVHVEPISVAAPQEVEELAKIEEDVSSQGETPVTEVEKVVEVDNAQPKEMVEDVRKVVPIEEKAAESIIDAAAEPHSPTEASQESEPKQEVVSTIAHTAASTESTDSPVEPITPTVVVQDLEPVQDKEVAPVPQALERPKSPFSPSFTVTTVGGSVAEAEVPIEEQPEEAAASLAADDSKPSELPPPRPWTPSYSVHSQGSPLQSRVALDDDVPAEPLSKEAPEEEKVAKDAAPEQSEVPVEAPIEAAVEETIQPIANVSSKEAEAPAVLAVEEAQGPVDSITAPVPLIAPVPLASSSWVPSYSVSRQGSPLPKTPQPVEKSLPLEEPAAQAPVAAESFWNGVKAVEDGKEAIQSAEIQVPKSGEQTSTPELVEAEDANTTPAVLRNAPATEPTIAPATESLVPPETPPRARLESNSSTSKLLPGGWFSPRKGSHDSRPSLETASGQFIPSQGFSSPIDSAPVLPPIATENLNVPSHEMGQNSASPSKKRWCTIM